MKNYCHSAILATDLNGGIGKQGGLLKHHPRDFAMFKLVTTGCIVVMGSATYHSLPQKNIFLERGTYAVVITREPNKLYPMPSGYVAMTEEEFLDRNEFLSIMETEFGDFNFKTENSKFRNKEIVMIGGAYLYNQMEKFSVGKVYLTTFLFTDSKADTFVDLAQPVFEARTTVETDNKEYIIEICRQPLEK